MKLEIHPLPSRVRSLLWLTQGTLSVRACASGGYDFRQNWHFFIGKQQTDTPLAPRCVATEADLNVPVYLRV